MNNATPSFQPVLYAGGLYDMDTKLIRFGARDYDPTIGRWTTKDPIGFAGGDTNLYAYVGGNPMSYNDPSGLTQEDAARAMAWIRMYSPNLANGLNPTFSDERMGGSGYTYSSSQIGLNMGYLDTFTGEQRIAEYINTIAHELRHAQDYKLCEQNSDPKGSYNQLMGLKKKFDSRYHDRYENEAFQLSRRYLNQNPFRGRN